MLGSKIKLSPETIKVATLENKLTMTKNAILWHRLVYQFLDFD